MAKLYVKSLSQTGETRRFLAHGEARVVDLAGQPVMLATFEPGWRWSKDLQPIVGTSSCQAAHTLYALSGRMHIRMDSGEETDVQAGDVAYIPAGHDAWVLGSETTRFVDFGEIGAYAQATAASSEAPGTRPEARPS